MKRHEIRVSGEGKSRLFEIGTGTLKKDGTPTTLSMMDVKAALLLEMIEQPDNLANLRNSLRMFLNVSATPQPEPPKPEAVATPSKPEPIAVPAAPPKPEPLPFQETTVYKGHTYRRTGGVGGKVEIFQPKGGPKGTDWKSAHPNVLERLTWAEARPTPPVAVPAPAKGKAGSPVIVERTTFDQFTYGRTADGTVYRDKTSEGKGWVLANPKRAAQLAWGSAPSAPPAPAPSADIAIAEVIDGDNLVTVFRSADGGYRLVAVSTAPAVA
jgi:hypothetical protein